MDFINFRLIDLIDILLVAILLFQLYRLVKGTAAIRIFIGILMIIIVWKLTEVLHMELVSNLLGQFIGIGAIAVIIIFQQELRRFLIVLGKSEWMKSNAAGKTMMKWRFFQEESDLSHNDLRQISTALFNLSQHKTGALLALTRTSDLNDIVETGRALDAKVSSELIESLFLKEGPLHDGGVIISAGIIQAASCIFTLSEKRLAKKYGLRHRAAVGITEHTDAIALVVSEERGEVALVQEGSIRTIKNSDELLRQLVSKMKQNK